jgi:hypothetical protein
MSVLFSRLNSIKKGLGLSPEAFFDRIKKPRVSVKEMPAVC